MPFFVLELSKSLRRVAKRRLLGFEPEKCPARHKSCQNIGFLKIQTRIEKSTNKTVALIEDRCLEDFARKTADEDKILIYEAV